MKIVAMTRPVWICCLAAVGVSQGQTPAEPHQAFICISGPSKRIISVFNHSTLGPPKSGSCRVDYTKDGTTTTIYTSKTGRAYCAEKAALLVTNLSKGNYSCRAETLEQAEDADPPEPPAASGVAPKP